MKSISVCLTLCLLLRWTVPVVADSSTTRFVSLEVYPPQITLDHSDDFQNVVAVATRADGMTLDVTELASWQIAGEPSAPDPIEFSEGQVTAAGSGKTQLVADFAGLTSDCDVHSKANQEAPRRSARRTARNNKLGTLSRTR